MSSVYTSDDDREFYFITRPVFQYISLNWKIEDFQYVTDSVSEIESPKFPAFPTGGVQYYFRFLVTRLTKDSVQDFRFYFSTTGNEFNRMEGSFLILNANNNGSKFSVELTQFPNSFKWTKSAKCLYSDLEWDKIECKSVNVTCKFKVLLAIKDIAPKPLVRTLKRDGILSQLEQFYDNQSFKDITFLVKGQEFHAHKVILNIRSPVFAAMFRDEEQESVRRLNVVGIEPEIFKKVLRFIYSDKVDNLKETATDLYHAAEKYKLTKLKSMCHKYIMEHISLATFEKSLEVAETHSLADIKQKCIEFVTKNLELLDDASFQQVISKYPSFALDVIRLQKSLELKRSHDLQYPQKTNYRL